MSPERVRVKESSPSSAESSFRELDHVFLQTQTRIWLGEVLHVRFDENIAVADLLADGEVLLQVSKVVWNMYCLQHGETKYCKPLINEHRKLGKHGRKYMPYSNVDKFLKVCQIFGLTGVDIFSPSDVVEKQDIRRVCMCVRSLSKKVRSKHLNVPDFDVVTHNIAMSTELVGGLRRSLEKALCSLAESVVYSSRRGSIEKYLQRGDVACQGDIFEEFYGVESNFGPSEFGCLFPTADHNDSLLSDFLSRRSSNGSSVMNESIEMSPCSVLSGNNEVARLHLGKSPQSCFDCEIHIEESFYCRHWKNEYPIVHQNYEKICPPDGRERDTFSEGFSSFEVDDFLKNELSDSYMPSQENVNSHLLGMDSLHSESTSESSDEIHDNNRMHEDKQFRSLEISASSNDDEAKVNLNVEKLEFMGYHADQPLGGDFKQLYIFEEAFEPKTFSDNAVMEKESVNLPFMNTQYGFNGKHQEVKRLDGYISQVQNASMSGHASGFDSCATANKGAANNDFRGHKDDILMCATNSSPNTFASCTDIEKNSTASVSDVCVSHEISKCSIEGNTCRSISGSISAAVLQSEPEHEAGSSIAARGDDFHMDSHYKCAFLNGGISSFSEKQICDLELWTCAPQYDLLDEEDMQSRLINGLVSCNGSAEILTLRLESEIEIGNSLSKIYADNQVVNGVVSEMEDSDSLKNRITSEQTCSSTLEYQSFMSNTYQNSSGENRIHRNSSFLRTQCNHLPMCVDSTAQGDAHNSLDATVEKLMLQADEDTGNCVTGLNINMGCFPNFIEACCDDRTSGGGNSEAMNEDKLRTSSDQVVKKAEETGGDENQVKRKLHKRLILSSFAGGAVFGVLFFVYHMSKRRTLKDHYYKNTKGKGEVERPILYQHQEQAIMGQQKPKEGAVYPGERLMFKG